MAETDYGEIELPHSSAYFNALYKQVSNLLLCHIIQSSTVYQTHEEVCHFITEKLTGGPICNLLLEV